MAEDTDQVAGRSFKALPSGWFRASLADNPVLRALLSIPGATFSWLLASVEYLTAQTRLATATGGWLDLAALDFFAQRIRRRAGQSDVAFRAKILAELLRRRSTRIAMRNLLFELTGREPRIFEPARPLDTGGYGIPPLAYGMGGGYGSIVMPGEVFIDVYRDLTTGVPLIAGYGVPVGAYGIGASAWTDAEQAANSITDDDILSAMVATGPAGIRLWVRIQA